MLQVMIIILLAAMALFAVYQTAKKLRRGGGCCGEHEQAEKLTPVKDKNKSHYPFILELKISGMTCSNCAKRVENALNGIEGVWASVDLDSGSAHVRMKQDTAPGIICSAVAKAGYFAELKA